MAFIFFLKIKRFYLSQRRVTKLTRACFIQIALEIILLPIRTVFSLLIPPEGLYFPDPFQGG